MKFTSLIPNGLSTLNLIFGFLSILSSINGNFTNAALFILFAILADAFDGKIARKVHAVSDIGKEFDSLADLVSFGVAGSLLIYLYALKGMEFGIFVPILALVCTALRLARFNIDSSTEYFVGLPSPAYGFFAAAFILSEVQLETNIVALIAVVISLAMVSNIKYPTFKIASRKFWTIIGILLIILIALIFFEVKFVLLPFIIYGLFGPIIFLWMNKRF
ncbi:TPA: CDP-diacylglycerol--serine O-phosphatidyltransferase [archaeon]|uniref:CDP-diacylglycerol--serine O-phosphatidyltransferase n=1 Tax=Candidatus Naiadarchaeum limnaeum TaxID=2756139 RepID=A0A832XIF7_9ARCH|nr:CDP-diacylglycerol--serine O-phosphatidyltransferase [Candidatus Naiadarchaeales archaeon SRR2090153.bin1042]HIK00726.1 CDP-diacylglycerol--serine O-phosphatidyltransferase [Candidatus Naiadarchaeum limnaeum]